MLENIPIPFYLFICFDLLENTIDWQIGLRVLKKLLPGDHWTHDSSLLNLGHIVPDGHYPHIYPGIFYVPCPPFPTKPLFDRTRLDLLF